MLTQFLAWDNVTFLDKYLKCNIEFEFSASHIPEIERGSKWVKRPPLEVVMLRFEENCILHPMCLILCLCSGSVPISDACC